MHLHWLCIATLTITLTLMQRWRILPPQKYLGICLNYNTVHKYTQHTLQIFFVIALLAIAKKRIVRHSWFVWYEAYEKKCKRCWFSSGPVVRRTASAYDDSNFLSLKKISYQFLTASYELWWSPRYQPNAMHLVDGVLAQDKLMNLMVELLLCVPRSIKQADTIWLCYISLVLRPRERWDSPPTRPGYEAMATYICTV